MFKNKKLAVVIGTLIIDGTMAFYIGKVRPFSRISLMVIMTAVAVGFWSQWVYQKRLSLDIK